ncbi:phosphonate ABC transporter, permease protein PhnE [Salsuginibacillus kocurii]|uniref:phosphonate ABC transporter, permease protein PhnE n=1 Tax=Salsuginibacillus kocurii TaxID=427078 RepID=UPI00036D2AFB|nr:phosphonate ABC transporter, permease protein PhnE [Salsuginibacillus kocurii]
MFWFRKRYLGYALFIAVLIILSMRITEFTFQGLTALPDALVFIWDRLLPGLEDFGEPGLMLELSLVTLGMAFLGTLIALLIAVPLSFAAARNTSNSSFLFYSVRTFLTFLRSVPDVVFGLILVVSLGLGPFPAVIAIILHNIGVLGKLISELIEAADPGPQEAVKATGATRRISNLFSILPQIWPNVLSHYFYRFEVAIRTSLILGIIGGGGIGQYMFNQMQSFNYSAMTVAIIYVMVLVWLVDLLGSLIRKRVI